MKLVVDTDVVAAALLGEEGRGVAATAILQRNKLLAPDHWRAELANVIWKAVITERLDENGASMALTLASLLPITNVPVELLWRGALGRAITHRHPVYDTLFVELAEREGTQVVSFDQALRRKFPGLVRTPDAELGK